jgi:hypothetical protein
MAELKINITNNEIKDNARVLNGLRISGDAKAEVSLDANKISGDSRILENLDINDVKESIEAKIEEMDPNSTEYQELRRMLGIRNTDKKMWISKIQSHLVNFSEGVLAGIVTNLLMGK